jgi:protein-tyrosine-phosphatase
MSRILVVGAANVCRSPYSAILLGHLLEREGGDWTVSSAGTEAVPGSALCAQAHERLYAEGIPHEALAHAARPLAVGDVEGADLILTATAEQRARVAILSPRATARTFTLLEALRLSTAVRVPVGAGRRQLRELVQELQAARPLTAIAQRRRPQRGKQSTAAVDIPDLHLRPGDHRAALARVHEAVLQITGLVSSLA